MAHQRPPLSGWFPRMSLGHLVKHTRYMAVGLVLCGLILGPLAHQIEHILHGEHGHSHGPSMIVSQLADGTSLALPVLPPAQLKPDKRQHTTPPHNTHHHDPTHHHNDDHDDHDDHDDDDHDDDAHHEHHIAHSHHHKHHDTHGAHDTHNGHKGHDHHKHHDQSDDHDDHDHQHEHGPVPYPLHGQQALEHYATGLLLLAPVVSVVTTGGWVAQKRWPHQERLHSLAPAFSFHSRAPPCVFG